MFKLFFFNFFFTGLYPGTCICVQDNSIAFSINLKMVKILGRPILSLREGTNDIFLADIAFHVIQFTFNEIQTVSQTKHVFYRQKPPQGLPYKFMLTFLLNFNLSMKNDLINFPHSNSSLTEPWFTSGPCSRWRSVKGLADTKLCHTSVYNPPNLIII